MEESENELLEMLSVCFDLGILGVAFMLVFLVSKIEFGGAIGSTLKSVMFGAIIVAFVSLLETFLGAVADLDEELIEILQRIGTLGGFLLIVYGFKQLSKLEEDY